MPWDNQNGDGGGRGPWGQGPRGGGGGNQTPDLEDLLRRGQDRFKRAFPRSGGGGFGSGGIIFVVLVLLGIWAATGIRIVQPNEVGVVTRFGAFQSVRDEGFHLILPWPIDVMQKVSIKEETEQIGAASSRSPGRNPASEVINDSFMLTGDENIIGVRFSVRHRVSDPRAYLFNVRNQTATLLKVADSAMREVIGRNNLEPIRNLSLPLDVTVRNLIQKRMDEYGMGLTITGIELEEPVLPPDVVPSFEDVQSAKQDLEKRRNQAEAQATAQRNRARGQVDQILNAAQAYERSKVAQAEGQAERFLAIFREYQKAKDVTRQRIFLETMETVFEDMEKVLIDEKSGGSGVVPYLPLPEVEKRRQGRGAVTAAESTEGGQ
ncbi:MAG: FtsH protease activity modulator HflK [Alphaproteobacteria bacterium]